MVDAEHGTKQPAFDHDRLAAALSKAANQEYKGDHLPFSTVTFSDDSKTVKFDAADKSWECGLDDYQCKEAAAGAHSAPQADTSDDNADDEPRGRRSRKSPDGKWTARVHDGNVFVQSTDGAERQLSQDGTTNQPYGLVEWSPDSDVVVAWRIEPGDRKEVFNIESSPRDGGGGDSAPAAIRAGGR